jgi:molybdopterin converting factor subunit 1
MMRVTVLLFAQLAEALHAREMMLDLEEGATVEDALGTLGDVHDTIAQLRDRIAVAVNERYASLATALSDGDVLALIPPVSGG